MSAEQSIIDGLQRRSQETFNLLYDRNVVKAISIVTRYNGTPEDAKEIFHDALLTLSENVIKGKFEGKSKVDTYLIGIVKLKWMRELQRRKIKYVELKKEVSDTMIDLPVESLERNSALADKMKSILSSIDQACKDLITGFYYDQKELKQLADELGYTAQFVRVKKARCLNKLKKMLQTN